MAGSRCTNSVSGRCISLPLGSTSSVVSFYFQTGFLSQREEEVRNELERQAGVRARSVPCDWLRRLGFYPQAWGDLVKNLKWDVT